MFSVGHGQTTNFLLFSLDLNAILIKTASLWVSWNNRNEVWKKRKCCALVRTFTSHQFNLGLNPLSGAISELNLFGSRPLLERVFFVLFNFNFFFTRFDRVLRFHPPPPSLKCFQIIIWSRLGEEESHCGCTTALPLNHYIYLFYPSLLGPENTWLWATFNYCKILCNCLCLPYA